MLEYTEWSITAFALIVGFIDNKRNENIALYLFSFQHAAFTWIWQNLASVISKPDKTNCMCK